MNLPTPFLSVEVFVGSGFLLLWSPWQARAVALSFPSLGRPPAGPAALPAHAESIEFRAALEGEFRGPAAGIVEEPTQFDWNAANVGFSVLEAWGHTQTTRQPSTAARRMRRGRRATRSAAMTAQSASVTMGPVACAPPK